MAESTRRRALGRGLDALLPAVPRPEATGGPEAFNAKIEDLHPNRGQPRTRFDDASIDGLAASLQDMGMLEPILVRRRSDNGFEIVAGERRWRAAQRAGLHEVPVFVRELTEGKAFEAALVENLQREDLNPLEMARAFQRLMDEHDHSHESIARLIGKDRSTVANALRLLKLPDSVLDRIESRELSEGHGRALLSAGNPLTMEKLAREAAAKGWSVRETERHARGATRKKKHAEPGAKSANLRDLELRLTRALGTKVSVVDRQGRGHLQVAFSSLDELDRLLDIFMGKDRS